MKLLEHADCMLRTIGAYFSAKFNQVGQVLDRLGHQREGPACCRRRRVWKEARSGQGHVHARGLGARFKIMLTGDDVEHSGVEDGRTDES